MKTELSSEGTKETIPLLPARATYRTWKTDGDKNRASSARALALALASVGLLALASTPGAATMARHVSMAWTDRSGAGTQHEHALALSPEFMRRLDARTKTWTARVPAGMENARHADLKRMTGGRLAATPRSTMWTTSAYASVDALHTAAAGGVAVEAGSPATQGDSVWGLSASGSGESGSQVDDGDSTLGKRTAAYVGKISRVDMSGSSLGGFTEGLLGRGRGDTNVAAAFDPASWGLPVSFDAREKWPACASLIGGGRDQGNCGSCWAMAPAEVMSDRLCIQSDGHHTVELSPYELLACAPSTAHGCDGGDSTVAYEYAKSVGIVSGSKFGDQATCAPYPFKACRHPCTVQPTPACPRTCANGLHMENDKVKVRSITSCPAFDAQCIARELFNNGPVSSYVGDIYEEFYAYSDGVFRENPDEAARGENHGGHVIKVIGWGKDDAADGYYWLIVNSWLNWGKGGVGKIAVGQIGIGAGVETAVMDV